MSIFRKNLFFTLALLIVTGSVSKLEAGDFFSWRIFSRMVDSDDKKHGDLSPEETKRLQERLAAEALKKALEEERAANEAAKRALEEERAAAAEAEAKAKAEAEAKEEAEAEQRSQARWSAFGDACSSIGSAILWYLPNRVCDLIDCFTVEVGVGEIGFDVALTRYCTFGAGIGSSYMTGWSVNDQNGIYKQQSWYADFFNLRAGSTYRRPVLGDYRSIYGSFSGPVDVAAMLDNGAEDPFAIGVKAGCYVGVNFQLHPVEFLDFLAGFIFIDFKGDDN